MGRSRVRVACLLSLVALATGRRSRGGASDGAWKPPRTSEPGLGPDPTALCTIPRVDADSITEQEFRTGYLDPRRPVILTGATDGWRAMTRWRTKKSFLQKFGHTKVQLGCGAELSTFPTGQRATTISNFVAKFGDPEQQVKDEMVFDFVQSVGGDRPENWLGSGIRKDFKVPVHVQSMAPDGVAHGNSAAVLSLGDDGAGLPFHSHGAGASIPLNSERTHEP